MANKIAGLDFEVNADFSNATTVAGIETLQDQDHGLSHLHGDLTRLENEPLRSKFE
jgi:hypothetical protein